MAATSVFYRLVFDSRFGRDDSDTIRAVQNSIRTDFSFLCFHADGTEYTFQTGDTAAGAYIDRATGLDYPIAGTVTPTAATNSMVWARDVADVTIPSTFDLAFTVTSTGAKDDVSFNALYVVEATPDGGGGAVPIAPITISNLKSWAAQPLLFATSMTYNATYTNEVETAVLQWPDGSAGAYAVTSRSVVPSALGKTDAYTATHVTSGLTVTQAAGTRNINGMVTIQPALTIA